MPIEQDEDPFYCLLEDNKLVTSISVITDRLVLPLKSEDEINNVTLVIHVTVVNPTALFAGGGVSSEGRQGRPLEQVP